MKRISWLVALSLATSLATTGVSAEAFKAKETKIVGGVKAAANSWPFMVALLKTSVIENTENGNLIDNGEVIPASDANYQAQDCGASLIADKWVLTAAHCVVDEREGQFSEASRKVLVGTSDLLSGGTRIDIERIVVHPDFYYEGGEPFNDIALIELKSASTAPTISVSGRDAATEAFATVVGWGERHEGQKDYPADLYQVDVPVVDRAICNDIYGSTEFTENMFCAGLRQGGKDACFGDSGGPIMVTQNGKLVQVGITSWGLGCAQPDVYGIYTRLSKFNRWIEGYTKPASTSSSGGGSIFFLLAPLFLIRLFRRSVKNVAV